MPRHPVLRRLLTATVGLLIAASAGYLAYTAHLQNKLEQVQRVHLNLNEADRPAAAPAPAPGQRGPVNILLAGVDAGAGPSIPAQMKSGTWLPGSHRSDTIMIVHLTADRKRAYLVSIPRDTLVEVPGYGQTKINAAFSYGGPALYLRTVEGYTGLRMDHLALIDWNGFKDLTTALGGVDVYIPEDTYDTYQHVQWTKGTHRLAGRLALQYVRQRHGLAGGDFDRIARQQNFLRQVLAKTLTPANLANPVKLGRIVSAVTSNVIVDDTLTPAKMRDLAVSVEHLDTDHVVYVTVPLAAYDTVNGQSVIRTDPATVRSLFAAVAGDHLRLWLRRHPSAGLGAAHTVH